MQDSKSSRLIIGEHLGSHSRVIDVSAIDHQDDGIRWCLGLQSLKAHVCVIRPTIEDHAYDRGRLDRGRHRQLVHVPEYLERRLLDEVEAACSIHHCPASSIDLGSNRISSRKVFRRSCIRPRRSERLNVIGSIHHLVTPHGRGR